MATVRSGQLNGERRDEPVKRQTASWLAWLLFAVSVALSIAAVVLGTLPTRQPFEIEALGYGLAIMAFPAAGALIVSRQPNNVIGWLLIIGGLGGGLNVFLSSYVSTFSALPGHQWLAWIAQWIWAGFLAPTLLVLQLFPDGSVLTRRWRLLVWLSLGAFALVAVGTALSPGPFADYPHIRNPLGVKALRGTPIEDGGIAWTLVIAAIVLSAASLILRYRRSSGERRQQLKWVAYAAAVLATGWILAAFTFQFGLSTLGNILIGLGLLALPISVGVAILKYRLYDVDLVINRTLVYGLLTALLIGFYVAATVGLGAGARTLTGQENNSLVIAASTLAVAALFGPARRRIQAFIDRRFYRQKYNAARTMEFFSARLREQVDLDSLASELVGVVRDTMQPAHVSLWLPAEPPAIERSL
jgi:MFS family permease